MMLAALLLTVVHPTKNQSAHQMAQHTTMIVCFDRKCVFCNKTFPFNTLVVVKVRNC